MVAIAKDAEPMKPRVIRPQAGPQTEFLSTPADIAVYGGGAGGGKSFGMLLDPLRHCGTPGFDATIFRRTTPEITNPGAIWDESSNLYPLAHAEAYIGRTEWRFPSNATIAFRHMEHEQDKIKYQGTQLAWIGFDELTHFTETQFWYMVSRNRSTCGVKPYIRATCNPDADSWVAELVAWWIDPDTGYAIPERSGVIRWLQRRDGVLHWHNTREESIAAAKAEGVPDEDNLPKSFTFIAASLDDNPALTSKDPGYRAGLLAMPKVEQERLLRGNWLIRSQDGAEWGDDCWSDLWEEFWPGRFELSAMAIDPSKGKQHGDFAAIVFVGVAGGRLWVDAVVSRMSAQAIAEATVAMFREHGPDVVGMEDNANQDLAFGSLVQAAASDAGCPPLPMVHYPQKTNKVDRIYRLGPHINAKRFRFRSGSPGCERLESQLRGFPLKGVHDDGPDALEQAVWLLNQRASVGALVEDQVEAFEGV